MSDFEIIEPTNFVLRAKRLHPEAKLPKRATKYDAGYDLFSVENVVLEPNSYKPVRTGVALMFPELPQKNLQVYGSIRAKSGKSLKGYGVNAGVVDAGFKREISVVLMNHSNQQRHIQAGESIAQIVLEVHTTPDVIEVDEFPELDDNDRVGGFGSTNV